jgi:hypothetical protein
MSHDYPYQTYTEVVEDSKKLIEDEGFEVAVIVALKRIEEEIAALKSKIVE